MDPDRSIGRRITVGLSAWIALILVLGSGPGLADVLYQWTDEKGVRHFSNTRPPKGVDATVLMDEIPYDPETDVQRREQEARIMEERKTDELEERLEKAEREADAARREAEAARRRAERVEEALEEEQEDRSYGIYYPRRRHPGHGRPGHRPPGHRPPGHRPPGDHPPEDRLPEDRPSWYPPYDPFPTYPDKPWQQPRRESEKEPRRGERREKRPGR